MNKTEQASKLYLVMQDAIKEELQDKLEALKESFELISLSGKDGLITQEDEYTVLIFGGDGSLNYFLNKIWRSARHKKWQIIYFPMGTANDFAKSLKLSELQLSAPNIKDLINSEYQLNIPIMQCNDEYFINAASLGAPAKVTDQGKTSFKQIAGELSYYANAFKELIDTQIDKITYSLPPTDSVKSKSQTYTLETCGLMVSQGLYVGGGVKVTSSQVPNFGETFNFTLALEKEAHKLIKEILYFQKAKEREVLESFKEYKVSELIIKSDKDLQVKLDGEPYKNQKLHFKKASEKISFYLY